MIATIDRERWIRCGKCGHKLGKVLNVTGMEKTIIEIKCHSCKELNVVCGNAAEDEQKAILGTFDDAKVQVYRLVCKNALKSEI